MVRDATLMLQKEVADRLVAGPGSKTYGIPSVKLAWHAAARAAGKVPPNVFWPVPNVDSGLVAFSRREPPRAEEPPEVVDFSTLPPPDHVVSLPGTDGARSEVLKGLRVWVADDDPDAAEHR